LAVEAACDLTEAQLRALPRERRATHMVTFGVACSQAGHRDAAVRAFWTPSRSLPKRCAAASRRAVSSETFCAGHAADPRLSYPGSPSGRE